MVAQNDSETPSNQGRESGPFSEAESTDLDDLYAMVGFIVVQWGHAEQCLEMVVSQLHPRYGDMTKKPPWQLSAKMRFIKECLARPELAEFAEHGSSLLEDFEALREIRHSLIHGAIACSSSDAGVYHFAKLDAEPGTYAVNSFQFNALDFPVLAIKLTSLGSGAVALARRLLDHFHPDARA